MKLWTVTYKGKQYDAGICSGYGAAKSWICMVLDVRLSEKKLMKAVSRTPSRAL
jgi:hypothetical protein